MSMSIGGMGAMPDMSMMRAMREQMFTNADADQSGGLSKAEMEEVGKNSPMGGQGTTQLDEMFSKLDADGNGELSQAELENMQPPQMDSSTMSALLQMQSDTEQSLIDQIFGAAEESPSASASSSVDALLEQIKTMLSAYRQSDESETTTNSKEAVTA